MAQKVSCYRTQTMSTHSLVLCKRHSPGRGANKWAPRAGRWQCNTLSKNKRNSSWNCTTRFFQPARHEFPNAKTECVSVTDERMGSARSLQRHSRDAIKVVRRYGGGGESSRCRFPWGWSKRGKFDPATRGRFLKATESRIETAIPLKNPPFS